MILKWMIIILFSTLTFGVAVPLIGYSIVCMMRGNFDTSTWYFPLALDILVDSSTTIGWYLRMMDYIWGGYAYSVVVSAVIPYLVGCCFYLKTSCKHLRSIFDGCEEIMGADHDENTTQAVIIAGKIKCAISIHIKVLE